MEQIHSTIEGQCIPMGGVLLPVEPKCGICTGIKIQWLQQVDNLIVRMFKKMLCTHVQELNTDDCKKLAQ